MCGVLMMAVVANLSFGAAPAPEELAEAWAWTSAKFGDTANARPAPGPGAKSYSQDLPFSFVYGGVSSREFLGRWTHESTPAKRASDPVRSEASHVWKDSETGLEVRCTCVADPKFPVVEWTLYFKNTGRVRTPVISDILPADFVVDRGKQGEFLLHSHTGDNCTADSYEPHVETLKAGTDKHLANSGGRPTQTVFPYFNIEWPTEGGATEGVIYVVSWAGQWKARFAREGETGLRIQSGQETARFYLEPGEEVRTPLVVAQFWKGDWIHAQNVWRQWMIASNVPRKKGQLPPLPMLEACSSHWYGEMIKADTASQIMFVDKYFEHGIKLDYWWMDAGWYPNKTGWTNTGTWEVDTTRFPKGLREVSDYAHSRDVKSLVWFEPERVTAGTWLTENHPEWVLGGSEGGLLNLGNPEARKWLTDHVDKLIKDQAIDLYRQDFNMDPLEFWKKNDPDPDRQGITEIRHVEGYFAYWDELRRRHGGMFIDSCASGGRRNDLETLRRAVPLLRSDYIMEPTGNQGHTYALAMWFPFYGTGTSKTSDYEVRSTLCPSFNACWDERNPAIDHARLAKLIEQWRAFGPYYYGDYYPLTAYSLKTDQWIAWQFAMPDGAAGMVQAFRRENSPYESARFAVKAIDPNAEYEVSNIDENGPGRTIAGRELAERGLEVAIPDKPGTAFLIYKKKP